MASQTMFFSCGFRAGRGSALKADVPRRARSADEALRSAERLSTLRVGCVAYSVTGDPESDDFDPPVVLFKSGRVPPDFE